jgi:hypothetical protein
MRGDDYDGRPYCLTGECSQSIELCLTKSAPVASWCSAGIRAPFPSFDIGYLLLWALWGGRRARVVQAQRQIHRAWLGEAAGFSSQARVAPGGTGAACLARRCACRSAWVIAPAPLRAGHACVSLYIVT